PASPLSARFTHSLPTNWNPSHSATFSRSNTQKNLLERIGRHHLTYRYEELTIVIRPKKQAVDSDECLKTAGVA
ncbi:hypothetical protein NPIL_40651, partial [Nephila pilipes]